MSKEGNGAVEPVAPSDPSQIPMAATAMQPGRQPMGFTVRQEDLAGAIDVLKKQPWEEVYKIMPGLASAQPIYPEALETGAEK